jgi:hypothetical protein
MVAGGGTPMLRPLLPPPATLAYCGSEARATLGVGCSDARDIGAAIERDGRLKGEGAAAAAAVRGGDMITDIEGMGCSGSTAALRMEMASLSRRTHSSRSCSDEHSRSSVRDGAISEK